jgi:hypothetical protein
MSKINKGMVEHLNRVLKENGVGFEYILENETTYDHTISAPTIRIVVTDTKGWIDSSNIYCTEKYYKWLETWFKENYDITVCYNNTGCILWSNDFT